MSDAPTPMGARLRSRLSAQIDGSSQAAPLLLAAIVGLAAGLGAVGFTALLQAVDALFFDLLWTDLLGASRWTLLLLPALGGLLVGPLAFRLARETRGPGVAEILLAVETRAGRIHPRTAITKSLATALTVGSGGSAGREGGADRADRRLRGFGRGASAPSLPGHRHPPARRGGGCRRRRHLQHANRRRLLRTGSDPAEL